MRLLLLLVLTVLGSLMAQAVAADELERIRQRGRVAIGVKADYPPFGHLAADGSLEGLDADLAARVAKAIGVDLELVGVNSVNRLQKLEEGAISVVIATLADTARRREVATIIEPNYYASGVNLLAPKTFRVADWPELRGRKICATQGAYFNTTMAQRYFLELYLFGGTRDAKLALADRRCVGWIYDEPALIPLLREAEWADYYLPLKPVLVFPWSIAVSRSPEAASLARLIGDLVADWHRQDILRELERKWLLAPSDFLVEQHEIWTRKDSSGDYVCTRQTDGSWPAECRNPFFISAHETTGLVNLALQIKESTGLDITVLYDRFERGLFLRGLLVTLALIVASVGGSILFGIVAAAVIDARLPLLGPALRGVATFARMTPPLLQIYVVFFGVGGLLVARFGWGLDAFAVAAVCLAVYAGAANLFALLEAASVLRLREPGARVSLAWLGPLFRLACPPVMANTVNIIKATGIASAIAVPEIINASTSILAEHGNSSVMMNLLMLIYFLLVFGAVRLLSALERRVSARVVG